MALVLRSLLLVWSLESVSTLMKCTAREEICISEMHWCRCLKLFNEMAFAYTLLVFLSCSDKPDRNLKALFEEAYILCSKVAEKTTGCDPHAVIQSARLDGCLLKIEIEQPGSGYKNVEDGLDLQAISSSVRAVATSWEQVPWRPLFALLSAHILAIITLDSGYFHPHECFDREVTIYHSCLVR